MIIFLKKTSSRNVIRNKMCQ